MILTDSTSFNIKVGEEVYLKDRHHFPKSAIKAMHEENGGPGWVNNMRDFLGGKYKVDEIKKKGDIKLIHLECGYWWIIQCIDIKRTWENKHGTDGTDDRYIYDMY